MIFNFNKTSERPNHYGHGHGSAELGGSVVRPNRQVRSTEPPPNQIALQIMFLTNFQSKSRNFLNLRALGHVQYWLSAHHANDVERLFSTAGDIITNERNRLLPKNAAKVLFLRENLPRVNYDY